jgi:putative Holliday junction resolvase
MQENKKRMLGIDYGSKRVGLALSDESNKFALPLSVITNDSELVEKVEKIAIDNEVGEIVMGESRDFSGKPNSILLDSLEFKEKLEARGFLVNFEPEFLTSVQAERWQGKNELLDASAAAIILQSYLDKEKSA